MESRKRPPVSLKGKIFLTTAEIYFLRIVGQLNLGGRDVPPVVVFGVYETANEKRQPNSTRKHSNESRRHPDT